MEGIAKTAQPEVQAPIQMGEVKEGIETLKYRDVPIDVYRFFNTEIATVDGGNLDKLKVVSEWAFRDVETLGDGLKKLRDLEIKLGSSTNGKRWDKMFNWIQIQRHIDDMRKRQEALSGIRS